MQHHTPAHVCLYIQTKHLFTEQRTIEIQTSPYKEGDLSLRRSTKSQWQRFFRPAPLGGPSPLTHMWAELSAEPLSLEAWHVYSPWSSPVIRSMWRVPSSADITMPEGVRRGGGRQSPGLSYVMRLRGRGVSPDPSDRARSSLYQVTVGGGIPREGQRRISELLTLTVQSVRF